MRSDMSHQQLQSPSHDDEPTGNFKSTAVEEPVFQTLNLSTLDAPQNIKIYKGIQGYNQVKIAKEDQLKTNFMTDWADHLNCLGRCLDQCDKYGISLNLEKCQFGVPSGRLLDHIVSSRGIATDPNKVTRILTLPKPETVSGVPGFVGHVSYYRRFIHSFAVLCQPLTNLLKKPLLDGSSPVWTAECSVAFEALKQKLVSAPILVAPCWKKPFQVYVDASNIVIGSILSQKDDNNRDHLIYFASRQLVMAERNYNTTE
ncbi:uncharacterized mitochondrial protein AtMg00860-like [Physcomitrium patens]|uniref:uncharacterized mitochondrial protein AtMg00860-like n=1 Tax=Physcomitrium patens TaxID=3218 RepID=UPI000D17245D|nr:uncharacterized protein LOC112275848 [Physcomitrium patens]|eukprot:XP_024362295.1 uncharacterized protein LOC112275848 [Physcomitrella patens]